MTEKTVGDVVPNLVNKKTQINGVTEHLHKELEKAGQELIKYKVSNTELHKPVIQVYFETNLHTTQYSTTVMVVLHFMVLNCRRNTTFRFEVNSHPKRTRIWKTSLTSQEF